MTFALNHNYAQIARDLGFKFKFPEDSVLDWKLIGSIDIQKIIKQNDFENIENIISHVSEAPLGSLLNTQILDAGIAKYFHLAQLSLQYILFCMKFLDETVSKMKITLKQLQNDKNKYKNLYEESNKQILQLHKKIQQLENLNEIIYPCSMCSKNFVTNEMLNIHIFKNHNNDYDTNFNDKFNSNTSRISNTTDRNLINTIKLELEVKHLKERLNLTEKELKERYIHQCQPVENLPQTFYSSNLNLQSIGPTNNYPLIIDSSTQTDINLISDANGLEVTTERANITNHNIKSKESHDLISVAQNKNLEVLSEIKTNFNDFQENPQNNETITNQAKSIIKDATNQNEINEKLHKILNFLENIQIPKEIHDVPISDSGQQISVLTLKETMESIQITINDLIGKYCQNNEIKINENFQMFENHFRENFANLEIDVKNLKAYTENVLLEVVRDGKSESARSMNSAADNIKIDETIHTPKGSFSAKSIPVIHKMLTFQNEIDNQYCNKNTKSHKESAALVDKGDTLKMILSYFGRSESTQSGIYSKDVYIDILRQLKKKSSRQLNKRENFTLVRNKLRHLVEKLSKEKFHNNNSNQELLQKRKEFRNQRTTKTDDYPDIEDEELVRPKEEVEEFKLRLQRALESPIRKPQSSYRTLSHSYANDKTQH